MTVRSSDCWRPTRGDRRHHTRRHHPVYQRNQHRAGRDKPAFLSCQRPLVTAGAPPLAEGGDGFRREAPFLQVRVRGIEREREPERLVGLGLRLPQIIRSRACRSHRSRIIPTVLVHDRFGPIPGGDGSDLTWDGAETVPGVAAGINDRLVAVVDAGVEEVVA